MPTMTTGLYGQYLVPNSVASPNGSCLFPPGNVALCMQQQSQQQQSFPLPVHHNIQPWNQASVSMPLFDDGCGSGLAPREQCSLPNIDPPIAPAPSVVTSSSPSHSLNQTSSEASSIQEPIDCFATSSPPPAPSPTSFAPVVNMNESIHQKSLQPTYHMTTNDDGSRSENMVKSEQKKFSSGINANHVQRLQEAYADSVLNMAISGMQHSTPQTLNNGDDTLPVRNHQQNFCQSSHQKIDDVEHHSEVSSSPTTTTSSKISLTQPSGVPDFLYGFEKITGPYQQNPQNFNPHQTAPYSPTYTTSSFDNFHRLLGRGLSPTPQTTTESASSGNTFGNNLQTFKKPLLPPIKETSILTGPKKFEKSNLQIRPFESTNPAVASVIPFSSIASAHMAVYNTAGLPVIHAPSPQHPPQLGPRVQNDADCYSMCPQESADAARQHSAYYKEDQNNQVYGEGFDIDGVSMEDYFTNAIPFHGRATALAIVGDRSESDDPNSGNESGAFFNDSDETPSEVSIYFDKKRKLSTEGEVQEWYNSLVRD
jgi:hypothetical protein